MDNSKEDMNLNSEEQLIKQNNLLNSVISSLTHPFYVIDAHNYTVTLANSIAWDKEKAGEITCYALTHGRSEPCDDSEHPCVVKIIKEKKEAVTVEHIHNDKNRNQRIFEVHGYPIFDNNGNVSHVIEYNFDITDRKGAEEALLQSKTLLKTILDGIESLVYVADMRTYEILYINKYGRNIFGDVKGKICWQVLQTEQAGPCAFCTNDKLLTSDGNPADVYRWEFQNTVSGRWYDIHDRAVEWEEGRFVRLEIATDITERKKAEEEKQLLINELAEKKNELEEVIRVTSHDLRSPLVNVMGYHKEIGYSLAELEKILKKLNIPQESKEKISSIIEKDIPESVKYIDAGVAKMDSLLSGLLSLSRSGRTDLIMQKLDMNSLAADVISAHEFLFKENGAIYEISELPSCNCDEKLINQVFSNLIGNALKYLDPERAGVIKISGYAKDGNAVYCIEDNGIGIVPEEQKKIFEIFHQADPKSSGEGLGLNIVKKIVERHNGKVWVESEFGKGSRFYVSLPEGII